MNITVFVHKDMDAVLIYKHKGRKNHYKSTAGGLEMRFFKNNIQDYVKNGKGLKVVISEDLHLTKHLWHFFIMITQC